ncbi:hypothetical protein C8A00DRAFT_39043 [Chaetomidium leptoderma]|uniref:Uncharacterized protein n=1 Tax=Chaetomidium leptoderma TaxID=669021 RepID=A0AAN6VE13_9PEZI|nr:hypothetical protein C8A00DRAFT_39043 [Chaetomidium leptoderma]
MGRSHLNSNQKAVIQVMLEANISTKAIAEEVGCSLATCTRAKRSFVGTGNPFPPNKSRFNAVVLAPWAVQELLDYLYEKPELYIDEMQWFLVEKFSIFVSKSTIQRKLKEEDWTNKKLAGCPDHGGDGGVL